LVKRSFTEAGKLGRKAVLLSRSGYNSNVIFHLNQERTDREMNKIVKASGKILAGKDSSMECFAVGCNMTFEL